jgi:hypothetical protein
LDFEAGDLFWGAQDGGILRAAVALDPVGLVVADYEEDAGGGDSLTEIVEHEDLYIVWSLGCRAGARDRKGLP